MTANSHPLVRDPEVAAAAADRQNLRQHVAGKTTLQPHRAPQTPYPASDPTPAPTFLHLQEPPSMITVVASEASKLPLQQWTTVFRKGKTFPVAEAPTSKKGNAVERSITAKQFESTRATTETEH